MYASPEGLPEKTEPYTADLVIAVDAQADATITVPVTAYVQAEPVAAASTWGLVTSPATCADPAEGVAYSNSVYKRGETVLLELGGEIYIPFQSCDVDAIPVTHSIPSPYDLREFGVTLVGGRGGPNGRRLETTTNAMSITYSGLGAYRVRVTTPGLGEFELRLTLDGQAVSQPLPIKIVCAATLFEDADGNCKQCSENVFEYPPLCANPGTTLQTLDLAPGTWRSSYTSEIIRPCTRSSGCTGGAGDFTNGTDEYCRLGHTGPLCSSCLKDYYWGFGQACVPCGDTLVAGTVLAAVGGVLVVLFFLILWFRKAIKRLCMTRLYKVFRYFTGARVKLLISTYQIIGSVAWGVNVSWPEPFKSFTSALQSLYFVAVGGECFEKGYNYYAKLVFMTTWPLAATVLIFLWMFIRLAMVKEKYNSKKLGDRREAIKRECLWTFIVLAYCVMPSNSVYLFRIFQCDDGFGPDGDQYFLTADYSLQCYVPLHSAMVVYSIVMILVYPVGINVMYLAMLLYHREAINPPKDNMAAAIVDRQARPQIRFLSFIYKYYKPTSYTFELVESARRLLLGGLYVFFAPGNDSINTFAAFAIALVFFIIIRETMPFVNPADNTLLIVAQLQIMITFLGGFLLSSEAFFIERALLGWALIIIDLGVVVVAVWMQYKYGSASVQQELQLMEHQFRDAEMALTMAEMRSDVESLQKSVLRERIKRGDTKAKLPEAAALLEGEEGEPHAQHALLKVAGKLTIGKKMKKQTSLQKVQAGLAKGASNVYEALKPETSMLHESLYPCYVIALSRLQKLDELQKHEDLLATDSLEILTRTSRTPSGAFTFFISQNWESRDSPDNSMNTKLQWLKKIREHLAIPDTIEIWLWWDYVSIPQNNRSNQLKAIASLPNYASLCSRFVPLVRDGEAWVSMYGDGTNTLPVGTLEAYLKRGWCRLEMIAALCPKRLGTSRSWRPGPLNMRFRLHQDPHDPGVGRLLTAKDLADPREGKFNRPDDVLAIQPVLERIAVEYAEYENSGSTVWDTLIDVSARPQWLKDLAEQTIKKGRFGSFRRSKAMSTGSSQGGGLGASATSAATASRTSESDEPLAGPTQKKKRRSSKDRASADDEADPNVPNQSI